MHGMPGMKKGKKKPDARIEKLKEGMEPTTRRVLEQVL
jgi:hypothetical protein